MKYLIKIKLKNNENFFWVTERLNHGKPCKYIAVWAKINWRNDKKSPKQ